MMKKVGIRMTKAKLIALLALCASLALASMLTVYYTHQLPTEVMSTITLCTYKQTGNYDYTAKLKPNLIYNQSTLKPGEGTLFMKITESIDTTFSYIFRLSGLDRPANITIEYSIDTFLESPQWRKRINTVPKSTLKSTGTTADLSANHLVDISSVQEIINAIKSETGTYASTYNLTISPQIHIVVSTDVGTIDKYFTPSMTMRFMYRASEGDQISIEGLNHTSLGEITQTEKINRTSVMNLRYASYAFSAPTFSALAYITWMFIKNKPPKLENPLEEIIAPFEEIILEIAEEPSYEGQRITMKTLEDLVKLADGLEKPVFHIERTRSSREKESTHLFYVLDGLVRYEYTLTIPSIKEKTDPDTNEQKENENSDHFIQLFTKIATK